MSETQSGDHSNRSCLRGDKITACNTFEPRDFVSGFDSIRAFAKNQKKLLIGSIQINVERGIRRNKRLETKTMPLIIFCLHTPNYVTRIQTETLPS